MDAGAYCRNVGKGKKKEKKGVANSQIQGPVKTAKITHGQSGMGGHGGNALLPFLASPPTNRIGGFLELPILQDLGIPLHACQHKKGSTYI